MVLIDTVKQMESQGMQDSEIIQKLQEQGFDPREINDSLNQSKIKAAVSGGYETNGQDSVINNASGEMQQSVMSQDQAQQEPQQQYVYPTETYAQPQEYYQPQSSGLGTETITEIADQIFSEKVSDIKKALNILTDFKTITDAKVSALDARLKRIETIIEKLQSSIIGKVGEFGQAVTEIKDEMSMMQESFSKVVNQAVSGRVNVKEPETSQEKPQETSEKESEKMSPSITEQPRPSRKKQKDGFENYLSR